MTLLQRRKCIIGAALVVEIVLFSIITFVIAYVSSLNAIHHASQQLADSMVDTVSVRVVGYFESTEASVRQAALMNRYASLPADYAGPSSWYTEWVLQMRSLMMAEQYQVWAYAMQLEDVSTIGASLIGFDSRRIWVLETFVDGSQIAALGYRPVSFSAWDAETKEACDAAPLINVTFPHARSTAVTQSPNYYAFKTIYGVRERWCAWMPLMLNPDGLFYETTIACAVINASGAYLGQLAAVRHISLLNTFLQQAAVTPNAEIFILDGTRFLVAATTTDPIFTTSAASNASNAGVLDSGCISSAVFVNTTVPHIGCRASASTYSYAPLRSLAQTSDTAHYLTSTKRVSAYLSLAGSMYFIVCMPVVVSAQASSSMFLILFLPEADVMSGVEDALITAVLVCVTLCVMGSFMSSLLVATLIGAPSPPPPKRSSLRPYREESLDRESAGALVTLQMAMVYNKAMAACREFDQQNDAASRPRCAAVTASWSSAAKVAEFFISASETAVVLVVEGQGASTESTLFSAVSEHGGELHDFDLGSRLAMALWRPDDEAEIRAILCGLALIRSEAASRAAVSRSAATRQCGEVSMTSSPTLHDALHLLSNTAAKRVSVRDHVDMDPEVARCLVGDARSTHGRREYFGVATGAWQRMPRRVRFAVGSALPLRALLVAAAAATWTTSDVE